MPPKAKKSGELRPGRKNHPHSPNEIGAEPKYVKIRKCFYDWLKYEAKARGLYVYQVVEEIAAQSYTNDGTRHAVTACGNPRPWEIQ